MKHLLAAAILSATAIALPVSAATAAAATTTTLVPPGNSAASQYVEVVPTASGGRPTSSVHTPVPTSSGGSGGSTGSGSGSTGGGSVSTGTSATGASTVAPISASTRRKLDALGTTGRAAETLARDTAPETSPAASVNLSARATGSPAGELFKTVTGSTGGGGLGVVLPVILIGSVLGAIGLVLLKRRRAT